MIAEARRIAIFGRERARKSAELKLMAVIEEHTPSFVCWSQSPSPGAGGRNFDAECMRITKVLEAPRLERVAAASGCVVGLVGDMLYVAGDPSERDRGWDYVRWLLDESPRVLDADMRVDVSEHIVPIDKRSNLTDSIIDQVEHETSIIAFFEVPDLSENLDGVRLRVCGSDERQRCAAITKFAEMQEISWEDEKWEKAANTWDQKTSEGWERKTGDSWDKKPADTWKAGTTWSDSDRVDNYKRKDAAMVDNWEKNRSWKEPKTGENWEQKRSWEEPKPAPKPAAAWGSSWDEKRWDEKPHHGEERKWEAASGSNWEETKNSWEAKQQWSLDTRSRKEPAAASWEVKEDWGIAPKPWEETPEWSQSGSWDVKGAHNDSAVVAWDSSQQQIMQGMQPASGQLQTPVYSQALSWDATRGVSQSACTQPLTMAGQYSGQMQHGFPQYSMVSTPQYAHSGFVASSFAAPRADTHTAVQRSDPYAVLCQIGFPQMIEEWAEVQDKVWAGHPPLPEGWTRCWSKSHHTEYYVRLADMHSTFDRKLVMAMAMPSGLR